ncbi:peptidoglycan DD-metalloendopeptidase family protein [Sulfurovum sp.]|uniref:peptidoglycan DD-metalloendopeptidase family protein n=1 Tax=Sulfurovum sp. TaxID=1969726 RepID=UPI0025FF0C62|nr:peptidoglycan DD-metalloendopeptidase family protein [Sulfurovum sp.]
MKYIIAVILMISVLFGAQVTHKEWESGKTFSEYLASYGISADLLESISKEDQKFLSEIRSRYQYYELKNGSGTLLQALIPISEEMQIHLFKKKNRYEFDIIPIAYKQAVYFAKVIIEDNPYTDTVKATHQTEVAKKISQALKGAINTKKLHKGDEIDFIYDQKTRLGKSYVMPHIKVARVKMGEKEQFVYVDEDGEGYKSSNKSQAYTVNGKRKITFTRRVPVSRKNARFGMPLRHARITSSFSYRRWHPILHRYRPHHGTDFGARRGTPLMAVNSGRVSFAGWMGGYGKVVKIRHAGGYESLYAHQSRIRVKRGQRVKKGQIIGYVGSTGRSTGPHLHFGLMKNGRWIDPMKVLRKKSIKTSILKKFTKYEAVKTTKYKQVLIKDAKANKLRLMRYIKENKPSFVWDGYEKISMGVKDGK